MARLDNADATSMTGRPPLIMNDQRKSSRASCRASANYLRAEAALPRRRYPQPPVSGAATLQELQAQVDTLELENARLRRLALTDDLTGAYNRRYFATMLRDALRERVRGGGLALCLFDIDNFKTINDRHGHFAGDYLLRPRGAGGAPLHAPHQRRPVPGGRRRVRRGAVGAQRVGGAGAGPARARRDTRHCAAGHAARAAPCHGHLRLAWIAPGVSLTWEQAYSDADRALYRAKQAGKNRLHLIASRTAGA
ncbi:signaling protein [Bordetella pertussis]|nr:signaling protein [Bordetella pertussis]